MTEIIENEQSVTNILNNNLILKYLKVFFILLLLLLLEATLTAQTVVRGVITEHNSDAKVAGVMLYLIDPKTNSSISITQSKEDGSFIFKSQQRLETGEKLLLKGTLLGYKPLKQIIEFSEDIILQLEIEPTTFSLREVVIQAPAIREVGDTIIYRTSAYTLKQDETLSQVLDRMPGIEVVRGGQIKFEGKAINKFYIEQMDLLGRRYSIASNSLRPEDVAAVEIYRDHEPIRMLEKQSLSDRAALNIKLTEQAKGKWLAWFSAGVGASPFLYDLNARLLRFNATTQGIYFIKGNDTGKDLVAELRAHEQSMSRKLTFSLSDYASLDFYQSMGETLRFSPIGKRQRLNQSYVLSGNQLVKMGEYKFLRFNAIYSDECFNSSREEAIDFVMPNGEWQILASTQQYHTRERKIMFKGDYEHNGRNSFFNNKMKIEYQMRSSQDLISQDSKVYKQIMSLPYLRVENSTEYFFRIGSSIILIDNIAKYLYRNQSISISLPLHQSIESRLLDNSFALKTNWKWHEHQLDNTLQWDVQYHNINTESSWRPDTSNDHSEYLSYSISYIPRYNWKKSTWHLMAEIPISYYIYRYPNISKYFFKTDLHLRMSRYWSNNIKLESSYRYLHNLLGAASQFPGFKVVDSRRLTEILPYPYQGNTHLANINLSYTVPMTGIAIIANTNFSKSKRLYTSSNFIQNGFVIFNQIDRPSLHTKFGASLRLAQTFLQGKIDTSIRGSYNKIWSDTFVQGKVTPLISDNYSTFFDLSLHITTDIKLDYSGSLNGSKLKNQNGLNIKLPTILTQKHKGTLHVWLADQWSTTTTAEFHSSFEGKIKNNTKATFLDFGIKYHGKKIAVDLLLSNITNEQKYEIINVIEPHINKVVTPLRPFEILLTFTFSK